MPSARPRSTPSPGRWPATCAATLCSCNAVCPGWTATEMGGRGGRPVTEGAASILWAADLPDGGPTGTFTRDGRPLQW